MKVLNDLLFIARCLNVALMSNNTMDFSGNSYFSVNSMYYLSIFSILIITRQLAQTPAFQNAFQSRILNMHPGIACSKFQDKCDASWSNISWLCFDCHTQKMLSEIGIYLQNKVYNWLVLRHHREGLRINITWPNLWRRVMMTRSNQCFTGLRARPNVNSKSMLKWLKLYIV